jgi:hypothetical protein
LLEDLSRFDAPTGFAVAANSATAALNNRKECLAALDSLNRIGLKQDGVAVADDGTVSVGGTALAALNAQLHARGAGDLTLLPTAAFRRAFGRAYPALSNTDLKLINPAPVPGLLGDKAMQYWELYETPLAVPPWQPLDAYVESGQPAFDALEAAFVDDAPLVLKARSSTHGDGVWFYPDGITSVVDDWRAGTAPEPLLQAPRELLLQYAVPHDCDRRVIVAGDTPVSGEDRHGSPHTDRSNLNLVDTASGTLLGTAAELLAQGAVEPLAMASLDPAVDRAVEDLHETLAALAGRSPESLHTWVGWDFLVVDPDDERLQAVPADVRAGLLRERYRTRDGRYLVFGEGNLSPGSKERYVNAIAHGRTGLRWDSAANLLAYGTAISSGEQFEPGVPDSLDRDALATRYGI